MTPSTAIERRVPEPVAGAPLRVVHVITTLGPGGAERQVELLLRSSTNEVGVIALYESGLVGASIVEAGGRVDVLGMQGAAKLTAVFRLAVLLRRQHPDVVHVHLLSGQLFGVLAARLAGVGAIVSTEHSLMDDSIEGRGLSRWLRMVYRTLEALTHHTVAVSDTAKARLVAWGVRPERISVIANAVDLAAAAYRPEVRAAARRDLGLPDDATVIGAVGRLVPVKRFDELIRSLAPTLASPHCHLVIVGSGPDSARLATLADSLGIGGRLHLPGARSDVLRLLNSFDVFVSPSRSETFGIAVVEAVANGLPTVYEQCPALDDLGGVSGAHSLRATGPGDAGALRRAVEASIAEGGRRPVPPLLVERYGPLGVARAYDGLHRTLASSGRPSRPERSTGAL